MASYALGIAVMIVVVVAWIAVQLAWKKTFPGVWADPDALAGRMGCHGCDCPEDLGGEPSTCDKTAAERDSDQCRGQCNIPGSI